MRADVSDGVSAHAGVHDAGADILSVVGAVATFVSQHGAGGRQAHTRLLPRHS